MFQSTTVEITIGYLTIVSDDLSYISTTVEITIGYLTFQVLMPYIVNLQQ